MLLGKVMVRRLSHPAKASYPIASGSAPSAKAIVFSPVLLNPLMVFIVVGKVTFSSRLQPANKPFAKEISPSLSTTSCKPQLANAPSLMVCTAPGMVIFFSFLQPENAFSLMVIRPAGNCTVSKFSHPWKV